jgi:hypothetical protein
MKFSELALMILCFTSLTVSAGTPLIEFIAAPSPTQYVKPGQNDILFYTLRNNTNVNFPITISSSHPALTPSGLANTCGSVLRAHTTCSFSYVFTPPPQQAAAP